MVVVSRMATMRFSGSTWGKRGVAGEGGVSAARAEGCVAVGRVRTQTHLEALGVDARAEEGGVAPNAVGLVPDLGGRGKKGKGEERDDEEER